MEPIALLNDYVDADEGELAEALKPFYVDYLLKHGEEAGDGDRDDRDPGEGQREAGDADGAR